MNRRFPPQMHIWRSRQSGRVHLLLALPLSVVLVLAALAPAPVSRAQDAEPGPGMIAFPGADANIYLYDMASAATTRLTNDAQPGTVQYAWPTWSPDGQLAYFGVNATGATPFRLGIFVTPPDALAAPTAPAASPEPVFTSTTDVFTYAAWAPATCPAGGDCRDLWVLYTPQGGSLAVRNVRSMDGGTAFEVTEIAEGQPFYWDWSPDGSMMLWARYAQQLELYDVAQGEVVRVFDEQQGLQRSIDWSPVDNRFLSMVRSSGRASDLVVFDGEARTVLAEGIPSGAAFEWSPDATQVAYADLARGVLTIVDAQTAEVVATPDRAVLAFFWSPDGTRLAYLSLAESGDDISAKMAARQEIPALQWNVFDPATGISTRLAQFIPSRDMIYYLNFFDQFAHSHRLWSPDSRYLVYGELLRDGSQRVAAVDVTQPNRAPQIIGEGSIGIFSWQ